MTNTIPLTLAALALALSISTSCASIVSGDTSKVTIDSVPTGVPFTTDTGLVGLTPKKVTFPNGDPVVVTFDAPEGYADLEVTSEPRLSGAIVGNILFGGLIGLFIDLMNDKTRVHKSKLTGELVPVTPSEGSDSPAADTTPDLPSTPTL
jgi:hypothetical protein